jgi:phospholipase/lecithinase/hemolysin
VWRQLFSKHMIEKHQRIQSQWYWNIQNYCECPAHPTGIQPKNLKRYHQDGANRANHNKLPCPILQEL